MKTTNILLWPAAALLGFSSLTAQAVPTPPSLPPSLVDFFVNVDGYTTYGDIYGDPHPGNVNTTAFDISSGLGTITATISGAGAHNFGAFFDHQMSADPFNEMGSVSGTPSAGQNWEIDEPEFAWGDIVTNFENSMPGLNALDNSVGISPFNEPDDVSMAMNWDFLLDLGEVAEIVLEITDNVQPTSGFYLRQDNLVAAGINDSLFLTGSLNISCPQCTQPGGDNGNVPEPSILMLMGLGLFGLVANRRKKVA